MNLFYVFFPPLIASQPQSVHRTHMHDSHLVCVLDSNISSIRCQMAFINSKHSFFRLFTKSSIRTTIDFFFPPNSLMINKCEEFAMAWLQPHWKFFRNNIFRRKKKKLAYHVEFGNLIFTETKTWFYFIVTANRRPFLPTAFSFCITLNVWIEKKKSATGACSFEKWNFHFFIFCDKLNRHLHLKWQKWAIFEREREIENVANFIANYRFYFNKSIASREKKTKWCCSTVVAERGKKKHIFEITFHSFLFANFKREKNSSVSMKNAQMGVKVEKNCYLFVAFNSIIVRRFKWNFLDKPANITLTLVIFLIILLYIFLHKNQANNLCSFENFIHRQNSWWKITWKNGLMLKSRAISFEVFVRFQ